MVDEVEELCIEGLPEAYYVQIDMLDGQLGMTDYNICYYNKTDFIIGEARIPQGKMSVLGVVISPEPNRDISNIDFRTDSLFLISKDKQELGLMIDGIKTGLIIANSIVFGPKI